MEFVPPQDLVLECMLGKILSLLGSFVLTMNRVWSAVCCLTCGVIAAILPLFIPSCQDVEHTCSHCASPISLQRLTGLGGFLMARFRRGVSNAKLYPVDQGYILVPQENTTPWDTQPAEMTHLATK